LLFSLLLFLHGFSFFSALALLAFLVLDTRYICILILLFVLKRGGCRLECAAAVLFFARAFECFVINDFGVGITCSGCIIATLGSIRLLSFLLLLCHIVLDQYVSAISIGASLEHLLTMIAACGRYKAAQMMRISVIVVLVAQVNVVIFDHDLVLCPNLLLWCIGIHNDTGRCWLGRDADAGFLGCGATSALSFGLCEVRGSTLLSRCVSRLLLLRILKSALLVGIALIECWILDFRMSLTQSSTLSPCYCKRLHFVLTLLFLIVEVVGLVIVRVQVRIVRP
jgi:hypothetical protein